MKPRNVFLLIVLVVIGGAGIGFAAGFIMFPSDKTVLSSYDIQTNQKTEYPDTPTPTQISVSFIDQCPPDHLLFTNNYFSFCYPADLKRVSEASASAQRLIGADELLEVTLDSSKMVKLHLCTVAEPVIVSGYNAIRSVIRREGPSGCDDIVSFMTSIHVPSSPLPLVIMLRKTSGNYTDTDRFSAIEQSLNVDNTP